MTKQPALTQLNHRIAQACQQSQRPIESVTLLAVSKTRSALDIAALADQGLRHFGENYLSEALDKQQALVERDLVWHFIGPIQSNKTRAIANAFDWAHSIDRVKIAQRLNDQRDASLAPLNVCIQVNIDAEASKQGCTPAQVAELAAAINAMPQLRLRGLMAIPTAQAADNNRAAFQRLAMTLAALPSTMGNLDTLSMGMSADFETAIDCGATIVRVGTALFGPRH